MYLAENEHVLSDEEKFRILAHGNFVELVLKKACDENKVIGFRVVSYSGEESLFVSHNGKEIVPGEKSRVINLGESVTAANWDRLKELPVELVRARLAVSQVDVTPGSVLIYLPTWLE